MSRVGIVFYDELEMGWRPMLDSWLQSKMAALTVVVEFSNFIC